MKTILLTTIFITSLLSSLQSCTTKPASAPERHASIPPDATWAGGIDGGYWFLVTSSSGANTFNIKIYNEHSGEIDVQNSFVLNSNCAIKQIDSATLVQNIAWFNGEEIFLKLNDKDPTCSLTPTTSPSTPR